MEYMSKEYRRAHSRKHYARKRARINEFKSTGCTRCGEDHPATLELHHRDPDTKRESMKKVVIDGKFNNQGFANLSWANLEAELLKCDVLCSNCHRILHWDAR